jgi:hypothetical protein
MPESQEQPSVLPKIPWKYYLITWKCRTTKNTQSAAGSKGEYVLRSRAIDDRGWRQPLERDPSREDDYELNWCAPVRCSVA